METLPFLEQCLARWLQRHQVVKVYSCGQQLQSPIHSHVVGFPRFEIPIKGCYENTIEQNGRINTIALRPGSVLFAAPNCWNLPTWRFNVELVSILFGREHIIVKRIVASLVTGREPDGRNLVVQEYSTRFPPIGPIPHVLNALMEIRAANAPQVALPELSTALVRCVHNLLQNPTEREGNRAQGLIESVCFYLRKNYQHDITRKLVARQFNITPNHLSRVFQTQGHIPFNNYLTHLRIDRGKYLLCSHDLKLKDVASRCGYRDTSYFCRVFKRVTRATPAEYRAIYRSQNVAGNVPTSPGQMLS
jgi:AraC-like DNA-binding protein